MPSRTGQHPRRNLHGVESVDGRWGRPSCAFPGPGPAQSRKGLRLLNLLLPFCTWEATSPTQSSCWEDEMPRCGGDVGGRAEKMLSRTRGRKSVGWAVGNR